jgi:hypothetical protein
MRRNKLHDKAKTVYGQSVRAALMSMPFRPH